MIKKATNLSTDRDITLWDSSHWWYSLISATPIPEHGEAANVAVLIGNGSTSYLAYRRHLPRLSCLAEGETIEVLESLLDRVKDQVARGMDIHELQAVLGPQLHIEARRRLYKEPSDALVNVLVRRFLEAPKTTRAEVDELIRRSNNQLDAELHRVNFSHLDILEKIRPRKLYSSSLRNKLPQRVPELARAIRSWKRDVLIDSVYVEKGTTQKALRQATERIGRAFWVYNMMRQDIKKYEHRDIRLVGVLHPSVQDETAGAQQAREYIKHLWRVDAEVIDGNEENVVEKLQACADWATEGSD